MPIVYSRKRLRLQENERQSASSSPAEEQQSSPAKAPRKRRKLVQLHIDAGQSDLAFVKCDQCNLVYTPGTADEKLHRSRHLAEKRKSRPSFCLQPGQRPVREQDKFKYYAVRSRNAEEVVKQTIAVDEFVTEQLGGSEALRGFGSGLWAAIICLEGSQVKGYLYAERAENVRRASVNEDGVATVYGQKLKLTCCGVRKLWISSDCRRQGLASEMLDIARRLLIYGYEVPARRIAFTPPSTAGALLAKSYAARHGRETIFVYKC